ncbi:hypothetical protein M8C21_028051 [Ambrosia artemisiifolia]|uniref:Uncharacterized protein n=1 Tax=Ambrosia artemisiifolia TaxID=4212 RepID=A0AAD5GC22_AMBAR|nr:hypothetical protein M8C21_028051 [Ambrosia artemisiifolia]
MCRFHLPPPYAGPMQPITNLEKILMNMWINKFPTQDSILNAQKGSEIFGQHGWTCGKEKGMVVSGVKTLSAVVWDLYGRDSGVIGQALCGLPGNYQDQKMGVATLVWPLWAQKPIERLMNTVEAKIYWAIYGQVFGNGGCNSRQTCASGEVEDVDSSYVDPGIVVASGPGCKACGK